MTPHRRQAVARAVCIDGFCRWELLGTEHVIAELDAIADPSDRLRALLRVSFRDVSHLRAEASLTAPP